MRGSILYEATFASAIQASASLPAAMRSGEAGSFATRQTASATSGEHVSGLEVSRIMARTSLIIGAMRLIEFDDQASLFYISCNVGFLDR
jgi:hypothetical protein